MFFKFVFSKRFFFFVGLLEDRYERYKGGALFYREYGRTASYYANRTFVPQWDRIPEEIIPPNRYEFRSRNVEMRKSYNRNHLFIYLFIFQNARYMDR